MSGSITWEAVFFLQAFLLGIVLMVIYDLLRILRMVIPHNLIITSLEDLIYWIFNGLAVFRLLFLENNGTVRGFALGALFLGMLLYNKTVSPKLLKMVKYTLTYLKKMFKSFRIDSKKR